MGLVRVSYGRPDLFSEVGLKLPRGCSGKPFDGVVEGFLPLPSFLKGVFLLIRGGYGENASVGTTLEALAFFGFLSESNMIKRCAMQSGTQLACSCKESLL